MLLLLFIEQHSLGYWYIKQTTSLGLKINKLNSTLVNDFSDAVWAWDIDDRKSICGFVVYLGNNPI